jgi:hypothetical protein
MTGGSPPYSVDLEYSIAGSNGPWNPIISNLTNTYYNWHIPSDIPISYNCYIKISITDSSGNSTTDLSDKNFTIYNDALFIIVKQPNGNENWSVSNTYKILWNVRDGEPPYKFDIEISLYGQHGPWETIITGITGESYLWLIPDGMATSYDCYIRVIVRDSGNNITSDISDKNFTIYNSNIPPQPCVKVISPNGLENITVGSVYNINWSAKNSTGSSSNLTITLKYSLYGPTGPWVLIDSVKNNPPYTWNVPKDIPTSYDCYVKVVVLQYSNDTSDMNFTIWNKDKPPCPLVDLISPDGFENYTVGEICEINWIAKGGTGTLNIKIELSTTGSSGPWQTIVEISNNPPYKWKIPINISTSYNCYVRVSATDENSQTHTDTSVKNFTIYNPTIFDIFLKVPNGGENWTVDKSYDIEWITTGCPENSDVKLEYSLNGVNGPWKMIVNAKIKSPYSWHIPMMKSSSNCYIRITIQNLSDMSNKSFTIWNPVYVRLVKPNGGENWIIGNTYKIEWETSIESYRCRLEYSTSGITGVWHLITEVAETTTYTWKISNVTPSSNCYIKIKLNYSNFEVCDTSDTNFTISQPMIRIVSPNGGENLIIGKMYRILWKTYGTLEYVKLLYSTDKTHYHTIVDHSEDAGNYNWRVPANSSTNCYVKIIGFIDNKSICEDTSDDKFTIEYARSKVTGRVFDKSDNKPVGNATVILGKINGYKTKTDAQGYFEFTDVQSGKYVLSIAKKGYKQTNISITVKPGQPVDLGVIPLTPISIPENGMSPLLIGIGVVIAVVLLTIIIIFLFRGRKPKDISTEERDDDTAGTSAKDSYFVYETQPETSGNRCPVCNKLNDIEDITCFWCGASLQEDYR